MLAKVISMVNHNRWDDQWSYSLPKWSLWWSLMIMIKIMIVMIIIITMIIVIINSILIIMNHYHDYHHESLSWIVNSPPLLTAPWVRCECCTAPEIIILEVICILWYLYFGLYLYLYFVLHFRFQWYLYEDCGDEIGRPCQLIFFSAAVTPNVKGECW